MYQIPSSELYTMYLGMICNDEMQVLNQATPI